MHLVAKALLFAAALPALTILTASKWKAATLFELALPAQAAQEETLLVPVRYKCPEKDGNGVLESAVLASDGGILVWNLKLKNSKITHGISACNYPDRNRLTIYSNFAVATASQVDMNALNGYMEMYGNSIISKVCKGSPEDRARYQSMVDKNKKLLKKPIEKMENYPATLMAAE